MTTRLLAGPVRSDPGPRTGLAGGRPPSVVGHLGESGAIQSFPQWVLAEHSDEPDRQTTQTGITQSPPGMDQIFKIGVHRLVCKGSPFRLPLRLAASRLLNKLGHTAP